jgi:hypothetical protein
VNKLNFIAINYFITIIIKSFTNLILMHYSKPMVHLMNDPNEKLNASFIHEHKHSETKEKHLHFYLNKSLLFSFIITCYLTFSFDTLNNTLLNNHLFILIFNSGFTNYY